MKGLKILQVIIGIFIFLSLIIWIISRSIRGNKASERFYSTSFSTFVVSSNSYYERSLEFQFQNGFKTYLMPSSLDGRIMVGDSIYKEQNTYQYSVFRKEINGEYKLVSIIDYNEIF